jgi:hypothetical protein
MRWYRDKDAAPDIPILKQAKVEYAKLQQRPLVLGRVLGCKLPPVVRARLVVHEYD